MLPLLKSDLFAIMRHVSAGTLNEADVAFAQGASCCVVLASGGYPEMYQTGKAIAGIAEAEALTGVSVYHAGTRLADNGRLVTAGGRVLGVTAVGDTLAQAMKRAYLAAGKITFEGAHMRGDIGARALTAQLTAQPETAERLR